MLREIIIIALVGLKFVFGQNYDACRGLALIGEGCDTDRDCAQFGSVCHAPTNQCRCHPHYATIKTVIEKTGETRLSCQKLPDMDGQPCNTKCAEPLFCRNGRCGCIFSNVVNGTCNVDLQAGDRCSRHTDCNRPFMACVRNECTCIVGTTLVGNECVALPNCPFGGAPTGSCIRHNVIRDVHYNLLNEKSSDNSSIEVDNCPKNFICITSPESSSGHCCPATCPLSTEIDDRYSCTNEVQPGSVNSCPTRTHFCHRVSGDSFAFSICCKRPCQQIGPESLYLGNECLPPGFLNGPCIKDEQCDGGVTMRCAAGKCECRDSTYEPETDPLTDDLSNPPQRCQRRCSMKNGSRDDRCFRFAYVNEPCFIQEQCPEGSGCYRGRCICRCEYDAVGKSCVLRPTPTTTAAETRHGAPQASPADTAANSFINLLNQLLNGDNFGGTFNKLMGG